MNDIFAAYRFDGRYAVAVPVWVRVEAGILVVEDTDRQLLDREPLARVTVFESYAHAPRLIALHSGVTLEVHDDERRLTRELERAGLEPSWVVRLQARWPAAVTAMALIVVLCAFAYVEGLPRATRWAAFALPPQLEAQLGNRLLEVFDEHGLEPSQVSAERQAQIATQLARAAALAAPGVSYRLEFRRTSEDVINAFALPGGIIVMLDATVKFGDAIDENLVLGVLGHELGHVVHKHSMRSALQSLGIGTIGSLLWGDFSGTAASVPILLGQLGYSRSFESEADDFAVDVLRSQKLSPRPLALFFACLKRRPEHRITAGIPGFLSSHPATDERLARLHGLDGDAKALCPSD